MSLKKSIGTFTLLVLLIVGGALLINRYKNPGQPPQTIKEAVPKLEVATDPSFTEVKGELITGFPEFPVYPEAKLVQSAQLKKGGSVGGYRAQWELAGGNVPKVMEWYVKELRSKGWVVQPPDDPKTYGEQIATATKGKQVTYLRVELHEQGIIEIEVDMPPK